MCSFADVLFVIELISRDVRVILDGFIRSIDCKCLVHGDGDRVTIHKMWIKKDVFLDALASLIMMIVTH